MPPVRTATTGGVIGKRSVCSFTPPCYGRGWVLRLPLFGHRTPISRPSARSATTTRLAAEQGGGGQRGGEEGPGSSAALEGHLGDATGVRRAVRAARPPPAGVGHRGECAAGRVDERPGARPRTARLPRPDRQARVRHGVAGVQAERQRVVDGSAVPQGQRGRAGDGARAAGDARLRRRVQCEHAERLRLAHAHLRQRLDGRAGHPAAAGRREQALLHGVRRPGPAPRAPQHGDVDGRPRGTRVPAGQPHPRRRLGLQPARVVGRHLHLRRAACVRRGARAVGDLVRRPRPRAGRDLARGTAAGERVLARLAGHRAQPGGDGVRAPRAGKARRPRREPRRARAC